MNRTQKEAHVAELRAKLTAAPFLALADYRGVEVSEINKFRRTLGAKGIEYLVIKNTLAKRALAGTDMESVTDGLAGMTGWVISGEDPIDAAKTLKSIIKELKFKKNEKFVLKRGYFDGAVMDGAAVEKVGFRRCQVPEILCCSGLRSPITLGRRLASGGARVGGGVRRPLCSVYRAFGNEVLTNYENPWK